MNYFILFLFSIIILLSFYKTREDFVCINDDLLKPLNIGTSRITAYISGEVGNYKDTTFLVNNHNINKIINTIPIIPTKTNYIEYNSYSNIYYTEVGYTINKANISNRISELFAYLEPIFIEKSALFTPKYCNARTNCDIIMQDNRIKVIGHNQIGNTIIEGQMLLKYNVSSYSFLLDFVISDENDFSLHYLKLKGLNLVNKLPRKTTHSFVNNEVSKIITKEVRKYAKKNRKPSDIYKDTYSCFGRQAVSKANCENLYYRASAVKSDIGVWDKYCQTNEECPFYKANGNDSGKCNKGICELPLGAVRVSPRKYRKDSSLLCSGCKSGIHCCDDQKDKKLYPHLNSPKYIF